MTGVIKAARIDSLGGSKIALSNPNYDVRHSFISDQAID